MGRHVDIDDLIDSTEVAAVLGLASRNVVAVYRRRYHDFPAPVLGVGRCVRWLRSDIDQWRSSRRRG